MDERALSNGAIALRAPSTGGWAALNGLRALLRTGHLQRTRNQAHHLNKSHGPTTERAHERHHRATVRPMGLQRVAVPAETLPPAERYVRLYAQREHHRRQLLAFLRQIDATLAAADECVAEASPPADCGSVPAPRAPVDDWKALRALLLKQLEDLATW